MMTMPIRNRIRASQAPVHGDVRQDHRAQERADGTGMAMTARTRSSTLPACQWLIGTNVVPTAACVPADAATPNSQNGQQRGRRDTEAHAEVPSTNCAAAPTTPKIQHCKEVHTGDSYLTQ
jgi:hypothetical protein